MKIYQLKLTLKHIRPPIWRRVEVPADIKLGKLHQVIQIAMGWNGSHMHAFMVGKAIYGTPDPEYGGRTLNEVGVRLHEIVGEGDKLNYEYDFGDCWLHEVKVEKVLNADATVHYPRCTAGKRACPPDDCGGPFGYEELLEALKNPSHPDHAERIDWLGGDFDPEAFELLAINQGLWRMR